MKTLLNILKFVLVVTILSLSIACENITNPKPIDVIDEEKTATIEGTVYANLDLTNDTTGTLDGDFESAPVNTTIKVILNSRDFVGNPIPGVVYQSLTFNAAVDASGNFSVEVPALDRQINAEIYAGDFTAVQIQADSTQRSRSFSPVNFPYNVTIIADLTSNIDIVYVTN